MRFSIDHATVVTMNPDREILKDAFVLIEKNRIAAISDKPFEDVEKRIDATGQVLMPGLINAHAHCAMSIFRNYGNDVALMSWLGDYIWPLENHLTAEDIAVGARMNIAEMLRTGTTSFIDMYYEMDAVAQVVEETGIRALLTRGMTGPDDGSRIREQRELYLKRNGTANDRIRVMIGPHAIYTNTRESLAEQAALGRELGCGFHIHLSETKGEVEDSFKKYGKSPIALVDEYGMLDERTVAAHCVWLDDDDIALLKERKVNCCHNPASNMKLASGFMPVQKLLDAGVNVCIGTDGASSNNRQDLFADMHLGSLIAKGATLDPMSVTARTMLEMATINGAKALGRPDDLGSVEVGKLADLILVDFDNVHHAPIGDIEAALVYSTDGMDVTTTIVDGEILMENKKLLTIDEKKAIEDVERVWADLKKRGGHQ